MSFVLDNSVAIAWCFKDEQTPEAMALLDRVEDGGAHAPQLWPIEALNVLLVAQRRGRINAEERRQLAGLLRALPVEIDTETATRVWETTQSIAEAHALTAYDGSCLELAMRLGLPIATFDGPLSAAAQRTGVPRLLPARA